MSTPTFADELRARSDEGLSKLFRLRPDLITPIPADMVALASRATSAPSLLRAIEGLNQWEIQVLEAAAASSDPFSVKDLIKITDKAAEKVIEKFIELALFYRDGGHLRLPRALRDLLGSFPAGLGGGSATKVDLKVINQAPPQAKLVLEKLAWGPPRGSISDPKKSGSAVQWLLDNNLLMIVDSQTVELPREVGIFLRGGKVHKKQFIDQPKITGEEKTKKEIDRAAIASISNFLRWVEELANYWSEETPTALQSGGLGVRDLKKLSEHLGMDESCAAFVAEVAYQAGLVVIEPDGKILPTSTFDLWENKESEDKWRDLLSTWKATQRVAGFIGRSDSRNVNALSSELDRSNSPFIRSLTLELIAASKGISPSLESLQAAALWRYPHRRGVSITEEMVKWTVRECEWLGITGGGSLSTFGERFLNGEKSLKVNESLPPIVDHILIQGDNTAIAPGPLTIEVARHLSTFADIESRGGATVYRFNESSIRRGLDHGHTAEEIKSFLATTSKTPVPQPLEYLISDVAKKHGLLRVGFAHSYLRCEEPATISALLNDKRLDHLNLRQIAPQVLISDAQSLETLEELRSFGYFPAIESAQGSVVNAPIRIRAKSRARLQKPISMVTDPSQEILEAAIRTLRTGERVSVKRPTANVPRSTANETMELLQEYIGRGVSLQIGYADTNGGVSLRIIDPLSISYGTLIAKDYATNGITPFKIARITGVTTA
jgi:hypothetical protein